MLLKDIFAIFEKALGDFGLLKNYMINKKVSLKKINLKIFLILRFLRIHERKKGAERFG